MVLKQTGAISLLKTQQPRHLVLFLLECVSSGTSFFPCVFFYPIVYLENVQIYGDIERMLLQSRVPFPWV